ncbi:MAG TPA: hypothetical protein VGC85_08050 [Chthoniobacterales bacterium]
MIVFTVAVRRAALFCVVGSLPLFSAITRVSAEPKQGSATTQSSSKIPKTGAIYVDVTTDEKGNVARLEFLNRLAPEIQEYIRKQTLGKHFGVPNHTYRRHIEYELLQPSKKKQ